MTRRTVIVVAILAIGVAGVLLFFRGRSALTVRPAMRTSAVSALSAASPPQPSYTNEQIPRQSLSRQQIAAEVTRRDRTDTTWEWKIPIRFYGRVVDENERPVAGVDVHFQWTDLSPKGTSVADSKSDAHGFFSLENVDGKSLLVRLLKPGYYTTDARNQVNFEYANPFEESFHEPYADAPAVFHLRKQKPSPDVIAKSTKVMLQGDAATVRIGLDTGKPSATGELLIEATKPWPPRPMSPPYNWQVAFHIENGGFVDAPDQFAFDAPETGYTPDYTINMPATLDSEWKVHVERTLYFTFGEPKRYGRLNLRTNGNSRYIFLDYVINRAGGRNLEAQPPSEQ